MKQTFILGFLLANLSAAYAATYTWTGATNTDWANKDNWDATGIAQDYYPQSNQDSAVIDAGKGTIEWTSSMGYFGATSSIDIGSDSPGAGTTTLNINASDENKDIQVNSYTLKNGAIVNITTTGSSLSTGAFTLSGNAQLNINTGSKAINATSYHLSDSAVMTVTTENANFNPTSITLAGNSQLILSSTNALGFGQNFTVDFDTFSQDEHGTLTATAVKDGGFWSNGKTITFSGTLDATGMEFGDEVVLATFDTSQNGGDMVGDFSFDLVNGKLWYSEAVASFRNNGDGSTSLVVTYTIPEPATATLSLLALASLAARRRRK